MSKKTNPGIPHHSIIHVKVEKKTFESLPDGRVSTKMVREESYDTPKKINKVFYAYGDSLQECEEKADQVVKKLINKLESNNE